MKRIIQRTAAIVLGLMLGAVAWGGLESVTHISDLNSSWPLGSDLASTSDDHIRNIKVALKTDFPNINSAVNATPTQLNQLTSNTFAGGLTTTGAIAETLSSNGAVTNIITNSNAGTGSQAYFSVSNGTRTVFYGLSGTVFSGTEWTNGPTGEQMFIGTTGAIPLTVATSSIERMRIASGGAVTINAPTSGSALLTNGLANATTTRVQASTTSGQSFGLEVDAGTTSADSAITVFNAAGTTNYWKILGDGTFQGRGPTAAALVDMTPDTGTFTATYTGFTAGVTCTATWSRIGKLVTLVFCVATGTSNATTFTMTGLPAAIQPATLTQHVSVADSAMTNNSITLSSAGSASVAAASGTITFYAAGSSSAWTASNAKGFNSAAAISYILN